MSSLPKPTLLYVTRMVRYAGAVHLEPIADLRDMLVAGHRIRSTWLDERFRDALSDDERSWLEDVAADENARAAELPELAGELQILAAHKTIELAVRRMVGLAYPSIPPKTVHKFFALKQALKAVGVDLDSISGIDAFNELRCISNSIKHEGTVNEELAIIWSVPTGADLTGLPGHYDRLESGIREFAYHLGVAIAATLK